MNQLFKRLTAFALCAVMLTALLASCADNEEDKTLVDPDAVTESEEGAPTFEEYDWEERTFTILQAYEDGNDWGDNFIDNEEINGEPVNDAVIDRNRAVEEKYNVDVVRRSGGRADATTAAKSGTVDFELIYDIGSFFSGDMMAEGLLYDFCQLPYVDLTQSYWAPTAQADMIVADKMLVTTCDITMNRIAFAYFLIFNKRLLDDYGLEYPYELVNTNQWTVDNYYEMVKKCGTDVDGDTLWTVNDIYGTTGSPLGSAIGGSGIETTYTTKNEDGSYNLNVYTEKLVNIYNEYSTYVLPEGARDTNGWEEYTEGRDISMYSSKHEAARVISFGEGHRVFDGTTMFYLPELVGMEDEYGVVPNPKLEANQENYYHYINNQACMLAMIKQADEEFVGMIMEYMAYESQKELLPAFYEQTIKTKVMVDIDGRDEAMLDIIYNSVRYGGGFVGLYQGVADLAETVSPNQMAGEMLSAGNFASVNKRYSAVAQATLDAIYDFMIDYDPNR